MPGIEPGSGRVTPTVYMFSHFGVSLVVGKVTKSNKLRSVLISD